MALHGSMNLEDTSSELEAVLIAWSAALAGR